MLRNPLRNPKMTAAYSCDSDGHAKAR
jgi:hypothetical protein